MITSFEEKLPLLFSHERKNDKGRAKGIFAFLSNFFSDIV
jgi:hypothetical protein